MIEKKMRKRGVAAFLTLALSLGLVWQPAVTNRADAAGATTKYVKEVKVFTKEGPSEEVKDIDRRDYRPDRRRRGRRDRICFLCRQ